MLLAIGSYKRFQVRNQKYSQKSKLTFGNNFWKKTIFLDDKVFQAHKQLPKIGEAKFLHGKIIGFGKN